MPLFSLPFPRPLVPGTLVRRYNRFLADVDLDDGRRVAAHCVNTGRMEGLTLPGLRCWLSPNESRTSSLAWTWELVELGGVMVGANTRVPNALVRGVFEARTLRGFTAWKELRSEVPYGDNSRVDFLLRDAKGPHYAEVKNCHLTYPDGRGYFPDSVSERATKHLRELMELVRDGARATVIFTAQRADTRAVRPSDAHDPEFAETAREAAAAGVRFRALMVRPTPQALVVEHEIPADLKKYSAERAAAWMQANRAAAPAWAVVKRRA